jgi:hypothetical protein
MKISKQVIASLAGENIGQISSTYCQMVEEEMGRNLPKTKLQGLLRPAGRTHNLA